MACAREAITLNAQGFCFESEILKSKEPGFALLAFSACPHSLTMASVVLLSFTMTALQQLHRFREIALQLYALEAPP